MAWRALAACVSCASRGDGVNMARSILCHCADGLPDGGLPVLVCLSNACAKWRNGEMPV